VRRYLRSESMRCLFPLAIIQRYSYMAPRLRDTSLGAGVYWLSMHWFCGSRCRGSYWRGVWLALHLLFFHRGERNCLRRSQDCADNRSCV